MANPLRVSIFLTLIIIQYGFAANILFLFGGGNYSHKMSIWPLVMALTEKAHNVTFVSSISKQPKPNPKVNDIVPVFMKKVTDGIYNVDRIRDRREGKETIFSQYESESFRLCNLTMNAQDDPEFTNLLENGHGVFDLIIVNAVYGECAFFMAHHLGAKFVVFSSTITQDWFFGIFGLPLEVSWIPVLASRMEYPMTFWDRVKNMYNSWLWYRYSASHEESLREIYRKRFGLSFAPEHVEIERNASLVLVNSHYTIDFPRSLPPIFIDIGGMQCWEPEGVLPQDFKNFMDSAEEGVILLSFGSTIEFKTLSQNYLDIFFNMMRKFSKVGFIWRWDGELPENAPENLFSSKWLPQREILREKSVRALVTHGGVNSMLEATYYGVPVIAMPLFADQDFQAYRVQAQEIGVRLEAALFSQEILDEAVWKILNNPIYAKNMKTRSQLFRNRENPTETALSAVELVLKHDDLTPLKPMEQQQSFWVRQHLDVYLFCFFIFAAINLLIPYIIIRVCRGLLFNSK